MRAIETLGQGFLCSAVISTFFGPILSVDSFDEAITVHHIGLYPVQSDNAPQSGADFSN